MSDPFLPDNVTQTMIDSNSTVTCIGRRSQALERNRYRSIDDWCDYLNHLEWKKSEGTATADELRILDEMITPLLPVRKVVR